MKAAVTTKPGAPEVIEIRDVAIPKIKPGWVLIKVMAFGLNRSEIFTRRGTTERTSTNALGFRLESVYENIAAPSVIPFFKLVWDSIFTSPRQEAWCFSFFAFK